MTSAPRRFATAALAGAAAIGLAFAGIAAAAAKGTSAPTAEVKVGKPQGSKGTVRLVVRAKDPDSKYLRVHVPLKTKHGRVVPLLNRDGQVTGAYAYTPTPSARHAAARDGADVSATTDTFTVTVTDGQGGTVDVPVTVRVSPQNSPPVAGAPTVGAPDPVTGIVTGRVNATDPEGDPLTYQTPRQPASGTVTVNDATGGFTYTPTPVAPTLREIVVDNPVTITFTVIVSDGHGGAVPVLVTCPTP